jgi:hypothetical protein
MVGEMETTQLQLLGQIKTLRAVEFQSAYKTLLPTTEEENRVEKLRRMMSGEVQGLSDGELEVFLTKFGFLLDSWLDEYEQKAFDGQTLREVLREG